MAPPWVNAEVEDRLRERFQLRDVLVVDAISDDETALLRALGTAAAGYLDATLKGDEVIGISTWSATLLATVDAMTAKPRRVADRVIQVVGGVGNPNVQLQATRLVDTLAALTQADPIFMPAPGLVGNSETREALMNDPGVIEVMSQGRT